MPRSRLDSILGAALQSFRREEQSDAELLTRFLDQKDESAFETLVLRHTPAVRAACRGWLRAETDLDDASQATFLVLVQSAHSIRDRAALGRWLYGVAVKVARRLRLQRKPSHPLPEDVPARPQATSDDLRELLEQEVARLPEKYRLPVQLCYLAGLTTADAAKRLGWPKGTVLTRLAWARECLQKRLAQRGVAPAILAGLLMGTTVETVKGSWARVTVRAAMALRAGESPMQMGVSGSTMSLTEGVVSAMFYDRLKYVALAALLAVGLAGVGIGHWATASNAERSEGKAVFDKTGSQVANDKEARDPFIAANEQDAPKTKEARPGARARRREAVIRLPIGAFAKEVDASPYGVGRITWTYEEDHVVGLVEASVMGGEIELSTEAEISLSNNGTIYGLLTGVRINHLRLPENEEFAELKPFLGLWSAVEPLVNDVLIDLPFSYQFRVQGDRLVISNFRMLLAGPNPLGKLGGLALGEEGVVLAAFQALGVALEGTYTTADGQEKAPPKKRPIFIKPGGKTGTKAMNGGGALNFKLHGNRIMQRTDSMIGPATLSGAPVTGGNLAVPAGVPAMPSAK